MLRARILWAGTRDRRTPVQTRRSARWLHISQPRRVRRAPHGTVRRDLTVRISLAAHDPAEARLAIQIRASSCCRQSVELRYREDHNVDRAHMSLPEYSTDWRRNESRIAPVFASIGSRAV